MTGFHNKPLIHVLVSWWQWISTGASVSLTTGFIKSFIGGKTLSESFTIPYVQMTRPHGIKKNERPTNMPDNGGAYRFSQAASGRVIPESVLEQNKHQT